MAALKAEYIRDFSPCNQNCLFCNGPLDFPKADTERTKRAVLAALADGAKKIVFSGGEPTLRKDLLEIIEFSRRNGAEHVEICTNGVLAADKSFAAALRGAGADMAFVALHAHTEVISDEITGAKGTFKKTLRGIKNLHDAGFETSLNIVTNSLNFRFLVEYVEFARIKFPWSPLISFSFAQCCDTVVENPGIVPKLSQAVRYLKKAWAKCLEHEMKFTNPHCGIPVCFAPEYRLFSLEFTQLAERTDFLKTEMDKNRTEKAKPPQCARCVYDSRCLGFWRGYFKIHGAGEFAPVEKEVEAIKVPFWI